MWTNFRSLASATLETASDIKQHLKEITAGEYDSDRSEEEEEEQSDVEALKLRVAHAEGHIEKVYSALTTARREKEELQTKVQLDLETKNARITALEAEVLELRHDLEDRQAQVEELSSHYEDKLQLLLREKSALLHKTQQIPASNHEVKELQELLAKAEQKAEQYAAKTEELQRQFDLIQERLHEAKTQSLNSLDRSFLIHFIGNWYKSPALDQQEMLTSLNSLLKLTPEEQSVLGLTAPDQGFMAEFENYLLSR